MKEASVRSVTIQFDTRIPAVYLYLRDPESFTSCKSRQIRPGVIVDLDAIGDPIGIELLGPQDLEAVLQQAIPAEHTEIIRQLDSKRKIIESILSLAPV